MGVLAHPFFTHTKKQPKKHKIAKLLKKQLKKPQNSKTSKQQVKKAPKRFDMFYFSKYTKIHLKKHKIYT